MLSSRFKYTKGSPAAKAWGILRSLKIQDFPIDPRCIAELLGIVIWERELPDNCDGCLMRVGSASGILINARIRSETRRKFTIAHEIGHYLLENDTDGDQRNTVFEKPSEYGTKENLEKKAYLQSETRANQFAVELLMPTPIFLVDSTSLPLIGLPAINTLASQYGTSFTSTGIHYTRLSNQACAIVFSEAGIIRYFAYSNKFRKNKDCYLVNGQPIPPKALASRFNNEVCIDDEMDEIPLEYWCQPNHSAGKNDKIIEHSRRIPNTKQVITFLHIPN
ncbi:ImmA/IrrE family metallo-endopeptidase [Candidatus Poribacteria bacterium]|nr:ImmA/IrrE family metallo-endopeptidase [Candidatus Poribacteria bacterium]